MNNQICCLVTDCWSYVSFVEYAKYSVAIENMMRDYHFLTIDYLCIDKYRSKRIDMVESLLYLGGVAVFVWYFSLLSHYMNIPNRVSHGIIPIHCLRRNSSNVFFLELQCVKFYNLCLRRSIFFFFSSCIWWSLSFSCRNCIPQFWHFRIGLWCSSFTCLIRCSCLWYELWHNSHWFFL